MTAQVKGYTFSFAPPRQRNKYVYKNIMSEKRRRESVNRATTDKSSWQDVAMLNMTLIKGDDDSNNDDNNKPVRAFQFNVPETALTTSSKQSASAPNFLRRFCDSWIKCPAKVINIRSMQKKIIKAKYSHPGSPGICNLRPRRCICKFIHPRHPIGICLRSTPTTARRPMGGEGSRGSPAIDRSTWILVCVLARVLPLFRSNTALSPPYFILFFILAALLRSTLTGETGQA